VASIPYLSLILPAFNESATIRATIARTVAYLERRAIPYELIVAADGDDGTREAVAELARSNPALKVIGSAERRGKGRGVRDAAALAAGSIIGYADADYKVPIEEFDKIEPWLRQGYQVVSGSRALDRSLIERKQKLYRQLGSRGFRLFLRAVIGLRGISDSQCGFKFFQREAALELFRRQIIDGYMFDVELLSLAERLGYRIKEVPIRWRDDGDSRLELLRGNLRNVVDIFRIRLARGHAPRPVPAAPVRDEY
jgi:dolichyl-phosphate beta-glucosyltransferase